MRKKTLVLHIGQGKTGTSSIQGFLRSHRQQLLARGCFSACPDIKELGLRQDEIHCDHGNLRRAFEYVRSNLEASDIERAVWSSESLHFICDRVKSCVDEYFSDTDVRIIVYLRRQDEFAESAYLQWGIKHKMYPGKVKSFFAWLPTALSWMDYYPLVSEWVEAFGSNNVIVQPFERCQMKGGLLANFASLAGLPACDEYNLSVRSNVSYDHDMYELLEIYNSLFSGPVFDTDIVCLFDKVARKYFDADARPSRSILSPEERLALLRQFDGANSKIAREHLGRDDGRLFYDPWPDADEDWEPREGLNLGSFARVMMPIIAEQQKTISYLEKCVRRIESEHEAARAA